MKNLVKMTLTSAAIVFILPVLSFAEGKSIYGDDNRKDLFAMSSEMKALTGSIVSLWKSADVTAEGSGFKMKTQKYSEMDFGGGKKLCPGEAFAEQAIGAFCSGSLVGEDLVMTAGHCITSEESCKTTKLVFGFAVNKEGAEAVTTVPAENVYTCGSIVKRFLGSEVAAGNPEGLNLGADYALIKLDRKVTGRKPLSVNRGTALKNGNGIFVIGHPVGLPVKLADSATVRDFSKAGYFVADLDTFGGNSGSAVFNAATKKIEGILVRGDRDFKLSPAGCVTMATYEQTGGRGEDVTKVGEISASIPLLKGEEAANRSGEVLEVRDVDSGAIQPREAAPSKSISFD
jgi:V8-like Glu-specific endopeptidase